MAAVDIPWMIGGGIEHSVEVCRLVSYCASGGQEGIIGSKDLEVRARATPGPGVRVYPGAATIQNRGTGATYDMYATLYPAIGDVPVAATGAAARTDMVVMRVENPYQPGEPWARPSATDVAAGNVSFRRPAIISGVGASDRLVPSNLGYSAIPLARINLPPNTTTIQQSHITDLRQMTSVLSDTDEVMVNPAASSVLTSATMVNWPGDVVAEVDVPRWATQASLRCILSGIAFGAGTGAQNVFGRVQMMLGVATSVTQDTNYNLSNAGGTAGVDFATIMAGGTIAVPPEFRGTSRLLRIRGLKAGGNTSLTASEASTVSLTATWSQRPESNL